MSKIKKIYPTVSIITITQLVRNNCLLNLYELIKLQTYKNIIEWVIVEGSPKKDDADKNKENIENLIKYSTIKINYIQYSGKKLSNLRNIGNNSCSGSIIVCMDDDDYYPPERVSTAVEALSNSSCLIAGCSDIYLYEYFMGKLYKFKGFNQNHSTNNCMAFKKEYLTKHKHDDNLDMSEEKSFTNNFTEPMVQLNSKKCIVVSSHNFNTFNKREICIGGSIGFNQSLVELDDDIYNYIPKNIFEKMKNIFFKKENSMYDIVYVCGAFLPKWNPLDLNLGGSEQAVINLCNYWAKLGKKIAVYTDTNNNDKENVIHNGVEYINWRKFPFNHHFNTIILWRSNGLFSIISFNITANNIFWDLHDNFAGQDLLVAKYLQYKYKITKVLLKSNYHKSEFEKYFNIKLQSSDYEIIPNGIRIDKFSNNWDNVSRNPYRFCYVSYYTRGLFHIIPGIWSIIKKLEPRAELHIYYGMDMITDMDIKEKLTKLIQQPGIIDHGRQPVNIIVREKYMSNFQLYITNTISEIDCISIKESLVCGCIPLISNFGVFIEREGIHFDCVENDLCLNKIALDIINLLKNISKLDILREVFKKSKTILSWDDIGNKILKIIK